MRPASMAVGHGRMAVKDAATKPSVKRSKSVTSSIVELVVIVVVALGLALGIQAFIVKPYKIPSASMEPTLIEGQRVLVDRIGIHFSSPHVGEIVVFHPPRDAESEVCGQPHSPTAACDLPESAESERNLHQAFVAGPGDVIYDRQRARDPKATAVVQEKDSYIAPCAPGTQVCELPTKIRIPAGHWFMMGDNRGDSDDSRYWGPVPTGWIIGQAIATYWPPGRIGIL